MQQEEIVLLTASPSPTVKKDVILHPPGPVCSTREALVQIPCSDPLPSSKTAALAHSRQLQGHSLHS